MDLPEKRRPQDYPPILWADQEVLKKIPTMAAEDWFVHHKGHRLYDVSVDKIPATQCIDCNQIFLGAAPPQNEV